MVTNEGTPVNEGIPELNQEQAREIINRWSEAGFFRLRNMGDKIFIDEITPGAAFTIRLQTHYEQRRVQGAAEPYRGGTVDDRGRPPGPWEVNVRRPASFEERTEIVPIPHTERVQMCPDCAGQGRVTCPRCMGNGRTTCPWCGGAGFVQQSVMETTRDSMGNSIPQSRMVQRPCNCNGGTVVCSQCGGNRIVTCSGCTGSGQVKTFDQLVVRFQAATQGEVIDVTPVPDDWLGRLSGQVLVDQRSRRIESSESLPENVAGKVSDLLKKSHDVDDRQTRIILQFLHVERLPLYEVRYKYAGVELQLWICGKEQEIHAPNAPRNRQRVLGVIAALVAGIVAALGLVIYLLR